MNARRPEAERFWEKVDQTESCWLWTAGKSEGYGRFTLAASTRVMVYAHRWSYEQRYGPIPEGLVIDHLCRVRNCVNPDHLEAVTWRENVDRGLASSTKTECVNGHEFTPENTHQTPYKRRCRACSRDVARRQREARRGVAA